jgi:hypothetical protein
MWRNWNLHLLLEMCKLEQLLTIGPRISPPGTHPKKESKAHTQTCTVMFIIPKKVEIA